MKYPGKFLEANGVTVRRILLKSSRLGALVTPGDTVTVGGYTVKYERATADVALRNDRVEKITLGADLRVSRA